MKILDSVQGHTNAVEIQVDSFKTHGSFKAKSSVVRRAIQFHVQPLEGIGIAKNYS